MNLTLQIILGAILITLGVMNILAGVHRSNNSPSISREEKYIPAKTKSYGLYINNLSTGGTMTNSYGISIFDSEKDVLEWLKKNPQETSITVYILGGGESHSAFLHPGGNIEYKNSYFN